MQNNSLAQIALAVLVTGAIVGGLLTVGGPGQGRMERRDSTRLQDLRGLGRYVICLAKHNNDTLPDNLSEAAFCPGNDRLGDPFTGAPYAYERLGSNSFRVCTSFEAPDRIEYYDMGNFDPATGCYTHVYYP